MKRIMVAIVLALCAPFAGAASPFDTPPGLVRGGDSNAAAAASANQAQGQMQGQAQGQLQGQGQAQGLINSNDIRNTTTNVVAPVTTSRSDAKAAAGAISGAVGVGSQGQSVDINQNYTNVIPANQTLTYGGQYEVKSVPNVIAPNIYPTGTCMGSSSAGVGVMGLGVSLGTSWTDEDCRKQEVARAFHQMGMTTDAVAVLCSVEAAAVAPACMKATQQPAKTAAQGERGEADRRRDATVRTADACAINKADADRLGLQVCK